jgi:Cu-processing system ATP-binding protein
MSTIRGEGLCKSFGRLKVLDDIHFHIRPASVTAVLGPNASGKSTLIKSVLGLVRPDEGEIYIDDKPIRSGWEYRTRIGYMPQIARFPENLKFRELLRMVVDIRGASEPTDGELIEAFGLDALSDRPLRVLSGGTRQKINAALAFMFEPDILILDELTAGLDPISITLLKEKIENEKSAGKTILMTSHNMHEVDEMADHILFLLDGRTCFDGSLLTLKQDTSKGKLEQAIVTLLEDNE